MHQRPALSGLWVRGFDRSGLLWWPGFAIRTDLDLFLDKFKARFRKVAGKADELLKAVNARLKAAKAGVGICTANTSSRLYLRATLPPKPGSKKDKPYQQKVALGVYFNAAGLKRAESEAKRLSADLAMGQFNWADWEKVSESNPKKSGDTCAEVCERFKRHFFQTHHSPSTKHTWRSGYHVVFKKLPPDARLTSEVMLEVLPTTTPGTRSRKRDVDALTRLAKFAGIEVNLKPYGRGYGVKALQPRDIPSDELIVEYFFKCRDHSPIWANVYALMAVYGLRNHEAFLLDYQFLKQKPGIARVLDGKTGYRMVWPYHADWWELFGLDQEIELPPVSLSNSLGHSFIGAMVSQFFRRWGECPFRAYDLRHAWAVRTAVLGLDPSISARMMGHSISEHSRTYLNFISEASFQAAWEKTTQQP